MKFWSKVIAHEIREKNFWDTLYRVLVIKDMYPDLAGCKEKSEKMSMKTQ